MAEDFEILEANENPLFKRKEIIFLIESIVSPNKNEVKSMIADRFSVISEAVRVKKIMGNFGSNTFRVEANIYETKEDLDFVEIKSKKEIEKEKKIAGTPELKKAKSEETEKSVEENFKLISNELVPKLKDLSDAVKKAE